MDNLAETYRFKDVPKFEKGQDFQEWLSEYLAWQSDFLIWTEKSFSEMARKINWLIDEVTP